MDVLEKIDKLRLDRGWSINYLAMEAELTQSTLNNLYTRGAEPKLSTLRAICNAFGISLAEFFADEKDSVKYNNIDKELQERIAKLSIQQKNTLLDFLQTVK